jgi:hypothetical protein
MHASRTCQASIHSAALSPRPQLLLTPLLRTNSCRRTSFPCELIVTTSTSHFAAAALEIPEHDNGMASQELAIAPGGASCAEDDLLDFQHKPLDLKEASIRLVEVLALDPSGLVQCRIRHATTEDRYTCVSYVWGSPDETHLIHMNGRPFWVRRNIWDFLMTVASRIASESGVSGEHSLLDFEVWIDALCIDQGQNDERNHQVQQMGKIFSSAQRVIAWIGKKPQIASLFRYLREKMRDEQFFDADHYLELYDFCKDVYWSRAWVRYPRLNSACPRCRLHLYRSLRKYN